MSTWCKAVIFDEPSSTFDECEFVVIYFSIIFCDSLVNCLVLSNLFFVNLCDYPATCRSILHCYSSPVFILCSSFHLSVHSLLRFCKGTGGGILNFQKHWLTIYISYQFSKWKGQKWLVYEQKLLVYEQIVDFALLILILKFHLLITRISLVKNL